MVGALGKAGFASGQLGAIGLLARRRPGWVLLCRRPGCRRFSCKASWLRRDGIELQGEWLCSSQCLVASLMSLLREAPQGRVLAVPPRLPYRLALLRLGALSEAALQQALDAAARLGKSAATVLLESGAITEEQLAAARAMECGCAHYRLPPTKVAAEFQLPRAIGDRAQAVAVHGSADRWLVGFVERVDRKLLALAESVVGVRAEGCVITAARRRAQLALDNGKAEEIPARLPAAAASYLAQCALQNGADLLRVGLFEEELLWARFGGRDGVENLALRLGAQPAEEEPGLAARQRVGDSANLRLVTQKEMAASRTIAANCR